MRKILSLFIALISFQLIAQPFNTDRAILENLSKLNQASRLGKIALLNQVDKEYVNDLLIRTLEVVNGYNPNPTPTPFPTPGHIYNKVVAYQDDSCRSNVTELRIGDSCSSLGGIFGNQSVWSVSINDKCTNIPDTRFNNVCPSLVALASSYAPRFKDLEVFADDRCQANVATIDPMVNCSALGQILNNTSVWSVRLDDACVNISDTRMSPTLCQGYQDAVLASYEADRYTRRRGEEVEFFADDSCVAKVARIVRGTDCVAMSKLFSNQSVWSVRFRGNCVNISDTNFQNACNSYTR